MPDGSAGATLLSSLLTKAEQLCLVTPARPSRDVNPDPARTKTLTQPPGRIRFHQRRAGNFQMGFQMTNRSGKYTLLRVRKCIRDHQVSQIDHCFDVCAVCCGRDCTGARAEQGLVLWARPLIGCSLSGSALIGQ